MLRRPPLGELLPSAHDMGREYKIIAALWPTAGAGARAAGPLHRSGGDRRAVLRHGPGARPLAVPRSDVEDAGARGRPPRAGPVSFIDVLADLHALDPAAVGLADLGKPDAYVARQLNRWYQSWDASKTAERPEVDALARVAAANVPEQGRARVVHGDYGLHNCISAPEGYIAAVVDWEISTLGDPMADLAYALNAWVEPATPITPGPRRPCWRRASRAGPSCWPATPSAPGPTCRRSTSTRRSTTGRRVCIIEGVYARYLKGQKSTVGVDLEGLCHSRDRSLSLAVERAGAFGFVAP